MYCVHLTNFGYVAHECLNFDEALIAGKKTGFEFSIWLDGVMVGMYNIFSGWIEL